MKRYELPALTRREEPDGSIVLEGADDLCAISIRVQPGVWADPRARHLLPKLFSVDAPADDQAA